MINVSLLENLLIIASICSTITVIFIQKTKKFLPCSNCIIIYSLFVNILFSYFFSKTFCTEIDYIKSIWIGLFSFLGADTIYKSLNGTLASYSEINNKDIVGDITYE